MMMFFCSSVSVGLAAIIDLILSMRDGLIKPKQFFGSEIDIATRSSEKVLIAGYT